MPERARVFIAEDEPDWLTEYEIYLQKAGHEVVAKATNLEDALSLVARFEELKVNVAVIDGNLTPGAYRGTEGSSIVDAIKRIAPGVFTVGMSRLEIAGVSVNLGKYHARNLGEVVSNL